MNYAQIITESEAELKELEGQKLVQFQKRIRFLLLLKSGEAKTQETAGVMVGWKKRQSQKIWQLYRSGTIREVLRKPERFSFGKLSSQEIAQLQKYLAEFGADSLSAAVRLIEQMYNVRYTESGVCKLFARVRIKLKTARPSNLKKEKGAGERYKKTLRV